MGEVFVDDDSRNESRIFKTAASLGYNLDVVEVHISSVEVGNGKHCLDSDISHEVLALADHLGTESGDGAFLQEFVVMFTDVNLFLNLLDSLDCDIASLLEAVCDLQGMDTFVQKSLGLFKESAS